MPNTSSPIRDAMLNPDRKDWGMRVGRGKALFMRAGARIAELFPDGCRVQVSKQEEQLVLTLRNRVSGRAWSNLGDGTVSINLEDKVLDSDTKVPQFGSVSPERVEQQSGALVVYLPKELPPKQPRVFKNTRAKPAAAAGATVKSAPTQGSTQAAPNRAPTAEVVTAAPQATAPEPSPPDKTRAAGSNLRGVTWKPGVDLRTAVEAINAWKALDGDNLTLSLTPEGTLTALVQFS